MSPTRRQGELAIVLHTHMPYVEGFGTWPFGEEWLWEAIAGSYLPLLELLDAGAPLTLSLTPVLCDQLEAPGVGGRFEAFVDEVRRRTHGEDIAGLHEGGHRTLAQELERSWREYEHVLARFRERGGDLLGALGRHAQWTSSATHAVLPLLATDAGVRAQIQTGVDSHRARFGSGWRGGFWLPECAHAPYLEPLLEEAGVRRTCVELTNRFGLGAREHLRPLVGEAGVVLVPIDRATIARVWSDSGYPAHGGYRDYHHHTVHHHQPWANDGSPYDHESALGLARKHAKQFVSATIERLRIANEVSATGGGTTGKASSGPLSDAGFPLPGGGLVVCALDTELLGHWWYEGVAWLRAVVEECATQGLELVRLDEARALQEPAPLDQAGCDQGSGWAPSTWGTDGDLSTWSGPAVAEIAFATRAAELRTLTTGRDASQAALRELLALQASDWAFMVSRELAGPYARERFDGHRSAWERALADDADGNHAQARNLAPWADASIVLGP
jgi:1,4-alpha-glucan branching enzyme